jgi:hypothetical protein
VSAGTTMAVGQCTGRHEGYGGQQPRWGWSGQGHHGFVPVQADQGEMRRNPTQCEEAAGEGQAMNGMERQPSRKPPCHGILVGMAGRGG